MAAATSCSGGVRERGIIRVARDAVRGARAASRPCYCASTSAAVDRVAANGRAHRPLKKQAPGCTYTGLWARRTMPMPSQ